DGEGSDTGGSGSPTALTETISRASSSSTVPTENRDDDELREGEQIGPDLFSAIKNSKILIPIISVNYGSSKWCLDELVQIMECKNNNTRYLVLPIFYKVKPAHVRHQIESFGDAFRTREKRFNPKIMEKWKQALKEVSDLKGWGAKGYQNILYFLLICLAFNFCSNSNLLPFSFFFFNRKGSKTLLVVTSCDA
ncbi:hypothetical protein EUGRSUZ_H02581, partial [Eucalyptus grandis]